jgi:hypothetical protein
MLRRRRKPIKSLVLRESLLLRLRPLLVVGTRRLPKLRPSSLLIWKPSSR